MEGFQINYTDIYDLFWEYKTNLENLMNKLLLVRTALIFL